ncbi:hypothetical protein H9I32_21265 [Bacillus sp. Xin]|uniref:hypothetical protein n=1 Tax=unclassified Bacillus (in: firmicutes) TaxID=185979 RepID=UPI00157255D4|nr:MULTISPECIES: hypothetical protein [unclassified Bacillus (in: firmicutes)]MBC6974826.1 hypothetical protein [Bacillus sp. Xin]NSW37070.1 hypothetical protein [Bacillus sp. Xin1]
MHQLMLFIFLAVFFILELTLLRILFANQINKIFNILSEGQKFSPDNVYSKKNMNPNSVLIRAFNPKKYY